MSWSSDEVAILKDGIAESPKSAAEIEKEVAQYAETERERLGLKTKRIDFAAPGKFVDPVLLHCQERAGRVCPVLRVLANDAEDLLGQEVEDRYRHGLIETGHCDTLIAIVHGG